MTIFLVLSILSCTHTVERPENLISEDQMVRILSDIYIHQQSSYLLEVENSKPDFAKIDVAIIESHGVKIQDFENSYKYYVLSPETYNDLLTKVRDNLEQKLPKEEQIKRKEERKKEE